MEIFTIYLINVLLSFFKFLLFILPVFLVLFLFRKRIGEARTKQIALYTLVAMLVFSAIQSANTPKNITYDRSQTQSSIDQINLERYWMGRELTIEDKTRHPKMSDEERAKNFDRLTDWRNREKN
jgi:hypothetical protein